MRAVAQGSVFHVEDGGAKGVSRMSRMSRISRLACLTCHVSHVMSPMSCLTFHVSHVMSCLTRHVPFLAPPSANRPLLTVSWGVMDVELVNFDMRGKFVATS